MARRIGEAVAVRVADRPSTAQGTAGAAHDALVHSPGEAPASFIWRDRVYVVREVLGYWRERRAWWAAPAARAVHGDPAPGGAAEPAEGLRLAIDHEREVWRVEARGPRTVGGGVYDISREAAQAPGQSDPFWRLLTVTD